MEQSRFALFTRIQLRDVSTGREFPIYAAWKSLRETLSIERSFFSHLSHEKRFWTLSWFESFAADGCGLHRLLRYCCSSFKLLGAMDAVTVGKVLCSMIEYLNASEFPRTGWKKLVDHAQVIDCRFRLNQFEIGNGKVRKCFTNWANLPHLSSSRLSLLLLIVIKITRLKCSCEKKIFSATAVSELRVQVCIKHNGNLTPRTAHNQIHCEWKSIPQN